jgi:hypothetical protein
MGAGARFPQITSQRGGRVRFGCKSIVQDRRPVKYPTAPGRRTKGSGVASCRRTTPDLRRLRSSFCQASDKLLHGLVCFSGQRLDGFQPRREAYGRLREAGIRRRAVAHPFQQTIFRQRQGLSQTANRRLRGNVLSPRARPTRSTKATRACGQFLQPHAPSATPGSFPRRSAATPSATMSLPDPRETPMNAVRVETTVEAVEVGGGTARFTRRAVRRRYQ